MKWSIALLLPPPYWIFYYSYFSLNLDFCFKKFLLRMGLRLKKSFWMIGVSLQGPDLCSPSELVVIPLLSMLMKPMNFLPVSDYCCQPGLLRIWARFSCFSLSQDSESALLSPVSSVVDGSTWRCSFWWLMSCGLFTGLCGHPAAPFLLYFYSSHWVSVESGRYGYRFRNSATLHIFPN